MSTVTLEIDDKNLSKVLNILENLKHGLIKDLKVSKLDKKIKAVSSSLDKIDNKSRYLSKSEYKKRVYKDDDEFLNTNNTRGKYLSPDQYRKNLKK